MLHRIAAVTSQHLRVPSASAAPDSVVCTKQKLRVSQVADGRTHTSMQEPSRRFRLDVTGVILCVYAVCCRHLRLMYAAGIYTKKHVLGLLQGVVGQKQGYRVHKFPNSQRLTPSCVVHGRLPLPTAPPTHTKKLSSQASFLFPEKLSLVISVS